MVELRTQQISVDKKKKTFGRLLKQHCFSEFLKTRFGTSKRFGIEGTDTVISGLGALVDEAAECNLEYIIFGMAHRGRLSTLANVLHKPYEEIFAEFQDLKSKKNDNNSVWGNSGGYYSFLTPRREVPPGDDLRQGVPERQKDPPDDAAEPLAPGGREPARVRENPRHPGLPQRQAGQQVSSPC